MGHVNQKDENRYYIGFGDDVRAAVGNAVAQVPDHHRPYAQVTGIHKLDTDGKAFAITTNILGADARNDAGLLREHLAQITKDYPEAVHTQRVIAEQIADLIADDDEDATGEVTQIVLDQAEQDAADLEAALANAVDEAFADMDPMTLAALDGQAS